MCGVSMVKKQPREIAKIWGTYKGGRDLPTSKCEWPRRFNHTKQLVVLDLFLELQPTTTHEIVLRTGYSADYVRDTLDRLQRIGVTRKMKGHNGINGCIWEMNI